MTKLKKRMAFAAIAAVGCLAGIAGFHATESESKSALTLANIEALTTEENDCRNLNGYRQWNSSGKLFQRQSEFYDCCTEMRDGYSPKDNCH